ncbi:Hypothetical protein NTJ_03654 [Nesidiocoris tenuis]|uniref:Uncharacterized protein n=1 Tax=Nesidiocoris tenuis TaxID=355587 RepID=A0ABN7AEY6_9HEMI|nr:Hypothetical protein NTJ_03654 [Nesidiocoris tenuis]
MRFNERQLVNLASGNPDLEDRLWLKKKSPGSFKKEVHRNWPNLRRAGRRNISRRLRSKNFIRRRSIFHILFDIR